MNEEIQKAIDAAVADIKKKVNKSIEQLVRMNLKNAKDVEGILVRITAFNCKAGHKL